LIVRVPASSANLGPGFDVLACALDLWFELEVTPAADFALETELPVPSDRTNLCVRAFEQVHPADRFHFQLRSEIPLTGGLGSSAAAIVAGLYAGLSAAGESVGLERLFSLAAEFEGHPDNVAAAIWGGFVLCGQEGVTQLQTPTDLAAVLCVSNASVKTAVARAALKSQVVREDAVFNLARIAELVIGLERQDDALVAAGLFDRLHQDDRAHLYPDSAELIARARSFGALGATLSGAGPTVLVWTASERTAAVAQQIEQQLGERMRVVSTSFSKRGLQVVSNQQTGGT
jgi:homoserine kinase